MRVAQKEPCCGSFGHGPSVQNIGFSDSKLHVPANAARDPRAMRSCSDAVSHSRSRSTKSPALLTVMAGRVESACCPGNLHRQRGPTAMVPQIGRKGAGTHTALSARDRVWTAKKALAARRSTSIESRIGWPRPNSVRVMRYRPVSAATATESIRGSVPHAA